MKRLLISAGDYSADLHGESLVRALRRLQPNLSVTALGGARLKSVADHFLKDMVEMEVSGFSQPFKQFFKLKDILLKTIYPILEKKEADAVVLIDYYGFNIHVARKAKKEGVPVFYFVSPQVWASRRWRIRRLKESVAKMLVIFPFEKELYQSHGVPVEFVGHPIMDTIEKLGTEDAPAPPNGRVCLGLMPGSRVKEISRHLPIMLESFEALKRKFGDIKGLLFAVDAAPDSLYQKYLKGSSVRLIRERGYKERLALTLCLTASGTATLENALLGIPMVVIYQASWLTYLIARLLIQVPYVSMANILSGREVVPELIQHRCRPDKIVRAASLYLSDAPYLERTREELIKLRQVLGKAGAYDRAAASILADL